VGSNVEEEEIPALQEQKRIPKVVGIQLHPSPQADEETAAQNNIHPREKTSSKAQVK
jgi:hypothetical protein